MAEKESPTPMNCKVVKEANKVETFDVNSELTYFPAHPLSELDEVINDLELAIDKVIWGPTSMNCKIVEEANKVEKAVEDKLMYASSFKFGA